MEYLHQFILVNGYEIINNNVSNQGEKIIYEVLRIIDSVPVFWEKHFQRLSNSAKIINKIIPFSAQEFKNSLEKIIALNQINAGNIKVTLEYQNSPGPFRVVFGFIPHHYPSPEEYENGVTTISNINQRMNPEAKVQNDTLRSELNKIIQNGNAFEAVLVHPDGYITEGSRSNLFFIIGNTIVTAPDKVVLSGITRENTIQICRNNSYAISFESLKYSDLPKVDASFLTGTSPKVLPIKSLDHFTFRLPHPMIREISKQYDELIFSYIASYKKDRD